MTADTAALQGCSIVYRFQREANLQTVSEKISNSTFAIDYPLPLLLNARS